MGRHKSRAWNRRRFLKTGGTAAIALPLSATLPRMAHAGKGAAPARYVSLFFGNGMPSNIANRGFSGVGLRPLKALFDANKLTMVRGLVVNESNGNGIHNAASPRFGVGRKNVSSAAGGQSLDDALHRKYAPDSLLLNLLLTSKKISRTKELRHYNSWRKANSFNDHRRSPHAAFQDVFGKVGSGSGGQQSPEEQRAIRYENRVMDAVVDQYRTIRDGKEYSKGVRALIADHFELVDSLERRAIEMQFNAELCDVLMEKNNEFCVVNGAGQDKCYPKGLEPTQACSPTTCRGDGSTYYGAGGTNWNVVWPLLCDIHVAAMRCGIVRFGTLCCTGGGDRYDLSEIGISKSPHELGHKWGEEGMVTNNRFDECVEWVMAKIAYYLERLDDKDFPDPNGGTLLDNTLVMIGSEMSYQHFNDDWTFFLAGGGGRIRPGIRTFDGKSDVDFYSTVARAMKLGNDDMIFGSEGEYSNHLDLVL